MAVSVKFEPIIPPEMNPELYRLAVLKEMDRQTQINKRMLKKTTTTWKAPKPVFKTEVKVSERTGAEGRVWTEDDRWNWTDQGTKPHIIRSRKGKNLRFKTGGKPKTRVRKLGSGRGRAGKNWVTTKSVRHPGTKARNWSDEVTKRRRKFFVKQMNEAHKKGLRKAQRGR